MCRWKKWLTGTMCFLFLTGWVLYVCFENMNASAQEQFGQVTLRDGYLNVRDGAGTEYRIIDALYDGELVQLMDSRTSGAGDIWYKVFFVREGIERIGYVHSNYITIVGFEDYEADLAFEDELKRRSL